MTATMTVYQRCTTDQCPHCAAGCPAAPEGYLPGGPTNELDDEARTALPPQFHRPYFEGLGRPNAWLCEVCWGDGTVQQWPCHVASAHGAEVAQALGVGWSR